MSLRFPPPAAPLLCVLLLLATVCTLASAAPAFPVSPRRWPSSALHRRRALPPAPAPAPALPQEEEETAPTAVPTACPLIIPARRIVGGTEVSLPFLAALWDVSTGIPVFRCSATCISASWLLSAAHCNVTRGNWVAIIGGADATKGPRRRILEVHLHAKADIALLKMDALVDEDDNSFALVNMANHLPLPRSYARTAGYGFTLPSSPGSGDMQLRSVDVPVSSAEDCQAVYGTEVTGDAPALCAGEEGCDSCLGDSGGPLFQLDGVGRAVVMGIVSAGEGCGQLGFPGVYARASSAVQWMRGVGAELEVSTSARQVFKDMEAADTHDGDGQEPAAGTAVTSTLSSTPEAQQQQTEDLDKEKQVDGARVGRETVFAVVAVGAVAGLIVSAGAACGWWRWRRL